ncbi:MAG: hypothetical protein ACE5H3_03660, partial [Planctomycetota bacterium]
EGQSNWTYRSVQEVVLPLLGIQALIRGLPELGYWISFSSQTGNDGLSATAGLGGERLRAPHLVRPGGSPRILASSGLEGDRQLPAPPALGGPFRGALLLLTAG